MAEEPKSYFYQNATTTSFKGVFRFPYLPICGRLVARYGPAAENREWTCSPRNFYGIYSP